MVVASVYTEVDHGGDPGIVAENIREMIAEADCGIVGGQSDPPALLEGQHMELCAGHVRHLLASRP